MEVMHVTYYHQTRKLCRNATEWQKNYFFGLDSPYIQTEKPILILLNYFNDIKVNLPSHLATRSPIHFSHAHNLH